MIDELHDQRTKNVVTKQPSKSANIINQIKRLQNSVSENIKTLKRLLTSVTKKYGLSQRDVSIGGYSEKNQTKRH